LLCPLDWHFDVGGDFELENLLSALCAIPVTQVSSPVEVSAGTFGLLVSSSPKGTLRLLKYIIQRRLDPLHCRIGIIAVVICSSGGQNGHAFFAYPHKQRTLQQKRFYSLRSTVYNDLIRSMFFVKSGAVRSNPAMLGDLKASDRTDKDSKLDCIS